MVYLDACACAPVQGPSASEQDLGGARPVGLHPVGWVEGAPYSPVSSPTLVSTQWTGAPGRPFEKDGALEGRELQAPPAPSHQLPVVLLRPRVSSGGQNPRAQRSAWVWAVPWTSGRVQGHPQHHQPSGTAGPCLSRRSWPVVGHRGALVAPRSGLQSPRGDATVVGVPLCSAVAA